MSTEIVTRTEQLSEYEARIEHGFTAFYDAGDALQKINEERLYQEAGYKPSMITLSSGGGSNEAGLINSLNRPKSTIICLPR